MTLRGATATSTVPPAQFLDPRILMSIRSLELRAKVVMEGFWTGLHRSPYHGFSVEFTEYRPYSPGDDTRYLDWRLFARTDRYFIKKFEDETNLRCHLLVDRSRSMRFGTQGVSKEDYAGTLAATLAYFLHLQGDAIGLMTFDEQVRDYTPARHRPGHLRHLMLALERSAQGRDTNLTRPLERIVELVRKRGLMVLISDLLAPIDRLETQLATLASAGHEVFVFQVLDPAEVTFSFDQAALFEDVESERQLYIDPALARREYQLKLEAHSEAVQVVSRKWDVTFQRLITSQPLELALFQFLRSRVQSGRKVRRAGMARRYG